MAKKKIHEQMKINKVLSTEECLKRKEKRSKETCLVEDESVVLDVLKKQGVVNNKDKPFEDFDITTKSRPFRDEIHLDEINSLSEKEAEELLSSFHFRSCDIEGLLDIEDKNKNSNITVSFRIDEEELEWIKEVARRIGFKEKRDINYQQLMRAVFLEKYPIEK